MAKKNPDSESTAGEQTSVAASSEPAQGQAGAAATPPPAPPRRPQGITIRYMDTGKAELDLHRIHNGRNGLDPVKRIDPRSLKTNEVRDLDGKPAGDPWLMLNGKHCMQVRADHAAELLECDELTGGPTRHRLATEAEIAAEKRRMQESLRK